MINIVALFRLILIKITIMTDKETLEESAETKQTQDVVVENNTPDIFAIAKEKFGRDIDEDYLVNDYKSKFEATNNEFSALLEKTKSIQHIMENPDLIKIADYMKDGVGVKEALEALSINPDTIPEDKLIIDAVKRANPYIKSEDDLNLFLQSNYGIGENLDELKGFDTAKYFNILKNRDEATKAGKDYLNSKKLELTQAPERQAVQEQHNPFNEEMINNFHKTIADEINSFENFNIGDVANGGLSKPYDKTQLSELSQNILFSGNVDGFDDSVTIIKGVTSKEILNALYLLKNQDTHLNEFVTETQKQKSIEAIKNADSVYNNVGGVAKAQPGETRMARMIRN